MRRERDLKQKLRDSGGFEVRRRRGGGVGEHVCCIQRALSSLRCFLREKLLQYQRRNTNLSSCTCFGGSKCCSEGGGADVYPFGGAGRFDTVCRAPSQTIGTQYTPLEKRCLADVSRLGARTQVIRVRSVSEHDIEGEEPPSWWRNSAGQLESAPVKTCTGEYDRIPHKIIKPTAVTVDHPP